MRTPIYKPKTNFEDRNIPKNILELNIALPVDCTKFIVDYCEKFVER